MSNLKRLDSENLFSMEVLQGLKLTKPLEARLALKHEFFVLLDMIKEDQRKTTFSYLFTHTENRRNRDTPSNAQTVNNLISEVSLNNKPEPHSRTNKEQPVSIRLHTETESHEDEYSKKGNLTFSFAAAAANKQSSETVTFLKDIENGTALLIRLAY